MPSDPRVARALELLSPAIECYRSALATTLEELRGHLARGHADAASQARGLADQLGSFGRGRIDAARLASVLGPDTALDNTSLQRLQRASDTLRQVMAMSTAPLHVDVPEGGAIAPLIEQRLADIGRAFAAARIAAAARSAAASGLDEAAALESFPFARWSAAERKLGPPLIVTVHGSDLIAGALAPFLDGAQKVLLIVEAPAAPAALVRLVTPGVYVAQAHSLEDLAPLVAWPATAVAALVPDTAARFVHDPAAGDTPWKRLTLLPRADAGIARVGGLAFAQQLDELRQLEALAAPPAAVVLPAGAEVRPEATSEPADRLAAWLLQQAQLATPSTASE